MSRAFIRDGDEPGLSDIQPSLHALIVFLTRENNGIRVYEKKTSVHDGRQIHTMSNGLNYSKDKDGRWEVV